MNPQTLGSGSSDYTTEELDKTPVLEGNHTDANRLLPPAGASTASSQAQWQEYSERMAAFLQSLPNYVTHFFEENQGLLSSLGLILLVLITIKLTLAVLDAIDDIPLIAPTLELIGIAYTGWFVYRYLLSAASRQELAEDFKALKEQVLGRGS